MGPSYSYAFLLEGHIVKKIQNCPWLIANHSHMIHAKTLGKTNVACFQLYVPFLWQATSPTGLPPERLLTRLRKVLQTPFYHNREEKPFISIEPTGALFAFQQPALLQHISHRVPRVLLCSVKSSLDLYGN